MMGEIRYNDIVYGGGSGSDDIVEGFYNESDGKFYADDQYTTEIAGETGKLYISIDTDHMYRYDGLVFVEISGGAGGGTVEVPDTIILTQAQYDALTQAEKDDTTKVYFVSDGGLTTNAELDDNVIAPNKVWSSQKVSTEIAGAGGTSIDDTTTSATKTWSSQKISTELGGKVDAVSGKGLSENDYTNTDKAIVDGVTNALADKVDKVAGKGLSTEDYTTAEKSKLEGIESGAEANIIESISVNGVAVSPDGNKNVDIIALTKAVNDLQNYYLKTETYTKTEVDNLVGAISSIAFEVVSVLPTTDIQTDVIYLVPSSDPQTSNVKDEYINLDGTTSGWEKIGTTDVDLSGYLRTSDVGTAAFKDVPVSGDAASTEVVLGNDSRLTDARNAADVSAWAKAANKPAYTASEVGAIPVTEKGVVSGVATLGEDGKVPSSQLPSLSAAEITALEALTDD